MCACVYVRVCVCVHCAPCMQLVVVNLCLASMEAELLGIDRHVCEVQLTTTCFVRSQVIDYE